MALKVLLDTSMLIGSLKLRKDPFREIENLLLRRVSFIVIESIIEELKRFKDGRKGPFRESALILELLEKKGCEVLSDRKHRARGIPVDAVLLKTAQEIKAAIATMDESLRREARSLRIPVISMRSNRFYCDPPDPEFW